MKSTMIAMLFGIALVQSGCAAMWAGAGAAGAATGYEAYNKRELKKLEGQRDRGEISEDEFGRRKDAVEDRSVVY